MEQAKKKVVNYGIISTARIATKVALAIQQAQNSQLLGVASRNLESAQTWAAKLKIPKCYGSYDELLQDKDIDVVYLPLPTALRAEWAIKAAKAKKHIIAEKPHPGEHDDKTLLQMLQTCRDNNVQFLDGSFWVYATRTQELK